MGGVLSKEEARPLAPGRTRRCAAGAHQLHRAVPVDVDEKEAKVEALQVFLCWLELAPVGHPVALGERAGVTGREDSCKKQGQGYLTAV